MSPAVLEPAVPAIEEPTEDMPPRYTCGLFGRVNGQPEAEVFWPGYVRQPVAAEVTWAPPADLDPTTMGGPVCGRGPGGQPHWHVGLVRLFDATGNMVGAVPVDNGKLSGIFVLLAVLTGGVVQSVLLPGTTCTCMLPPVPPS